MSSMVNGRRSLNSPRQARAHDAGGEHRQQEQQDVQPVSMPRPALFDIQALLPGNRAPAFVRGCSQESDTRETGSRWLTQALRRFLF